jgi:hypothetical protein
MAFFRFIVLLLSLEAFSQIHPDDLTLDSLSMIAPCAR